MKKSGDWCAGENGVAPFAIETAKPTLSSSIFVFLGFPCSSFFFYLQ